MAHDRKRRASFVSDICGTMKWEAISMKLEDAKELYDGEWIAFRATEDGEEPDGEVLLHQKGRREFDKALLQRGLTDVYITYAGPLVPEGYVAIF